MHETKPTAKSRNTNAERERKKKLFVFYNFCLFPVPCFQQNNQTPELKSYGHT
jgi:nitrate reductase NapE component